MKIGDSVKLADGKIATVAAIHEDGSETIVASFDDTWVLVSAGKYELIETPEGDAAELRGDGIAATAEPNGIAVDISKAPPDAPEQAAAASGAEETKE
jgi:hypothetical protein